MALANFHEICLPYLLSKTEGGYVAYNREYQPLGYNTTAVNTDPIDEEHYLMRITITPELAAEISYNGNSNTDDIFLWRGTCRSQFSQKSMNEYLKRLSILATLEVKNPEK